MTMAINLLIIHRGCSISSPQILQFLVNGERDCLEPHRHSNADCQGFSKAADAFESYTCWEHVHIDSGCAFVMIFLGGMQMMF
jgi:hypothetical protein